MRLVMMSRHRSTGSSSSSSTSDIISKLDECRGLVMLLWAHACAVRRPCHVASFWPLRARRTVVVCGALSGQRAVEFNLSVWAQVFFSREGRMKVVKTSDRRSWCCRWVRRLISCERRSMVLRLYAGGIERWSTSGVVTVSSLTSTWLLRRQQQYRAVGTTAAVWRWWPLKFRVKQRSFLSCLSGSDFCLVKLWLDSR